MKLQRIPEINDEYQVGTNSYRVIDMVGTIKTHLEGHKKHPIILFDLLNMQTLQVLHQQGVCTTCLEAWFNFEDVM